MSKYKPLADMVAPDVNDWKLVAENVKVSFQQRMTKEYNGKSYSPSYAKAKALGKAKPKGVSQVSRSTNPDLTLTGNMLKEITATSTGNQAKLEWNGANAEKITQLDKGGKFPMFVGEDPASKNVNKDIEKFVNKLYDRRVEAQSQKIVYKI
jgi:hypothetical protein